MPKFLLLEFCHTILKFYHLLEGGLKSRRHRSAVAPTSPDPSNLEASRLARLRDVTMSRALRESFVYFCFILVLFFLSYQIRDDRSNQFARNVKNMFVTKSFTKVKINFRHAHFTIKYLKINSFFYRFENPNSSGRGVLTRFFQTYTRPLSAMVKLYRGRKLCKFPIVTVFGLE